MFVGRKKEINELKKRYKSSIFQFVVIYGRRRIGKSFLIKHFIQKTQSVYFVATEQNEKDLLKAFSLSIKEQINNQKEFVGDFTDWEQAFNYLANLASKKRLILVIDEFPYLAKSYPAISSVLQKFIDEKFVNTKLFLILCGSSMSFMEKQVLGYESPLYGRRTAQIKLKQMPYYEAINFFPKWKKEEKLFAYSVCGGVPQYLSLFSKYKNFKDGIMNELLNVDAHLYEEPESLLKQELREPSLYNSILSALARGRNKLNELADATGKSSNLLVNYLKNLISLEIVEKKLPVEENDVKKTIYTIKDNLYVFWYAFIHCYNSLLQVRAPEEVFEKLIKPYFSEYFGKVFEEICIQYLMKKMETGNISELYEHYGHWWGTNPQKRQSEEIDIVMTNKSNILLGECKWQNKPIGLETFFRLEERGNIIRNNRDVCYYLFSKSGFEQSLIEYSKNKKIKLIGIDDLVSISE